MPMSTITVAGINPGLKVLGAEQQLNFSELLSSLKMTNSFIPTGLISSTLNFEFRNYLFSGFRWTHLTGSTDTYGSLTLQSFVNAQTTGTNLISFEQSGNIVITAPVIMANGLDMDNNIISNLSDPLLPQDAATRSFVENLSFTVTLAGAVTGTGTVNSTITTTLTPITTSQITNFNSSVTAFTLDQFAVPTTAINLNNQTINNVADPVLAQQVATKNFIETRPFAFIYMAGNGIPTTVSSSTWTKAAGITQTALVRDFTMPANNRIQYTGTGSLSTIVVVNASLSNQPNPDDILGISIFKNGGQIFPAGNSVQGPSSDQIFLGTSVFINFNFGDYVEVFIQSANGGSILMSDMSFYVIK